MNNKNYEEQYQQLVEAMGIDIDVATHQECLAVAQMLNKVKTAMIHAQPEKTGAFFITGESGKRDDAGLPENLMVCPTYGLAGFALYNKVKNYSEPGY